MPLRALLLIVCTMLLSGQNTLAENSDMSASPHGGKRRVSIMFAHYSVGTQIVNGYCWDTRYNRNITETLDTMTVVGGADTADAKLAIMEECGFKITRNPSEMGRLLKAML